MTTASYYLDSDYFKLIDFVSTTDSASKILSPFIFKKILRKEKNSVVTQELVKTPIVNLMQETEFSTQDGNTIIIKILTGSLSKTNITIQFNKSEIGTSVLIDLKLQTSMKFLLLKNKIEQKILNILQGRLINLDHLTHLLGSGNWNANLTSDGEGLTISKNSHLIIIYGWYYSALTEIFYSDVYSSLTVKDKFVIDIGSNVGDSSIYFVMKGAQKVIAVEPFPKNFNLAEKI